MIQLLPVFMSVRVTRRPPKSAPSQTIMLPAASNLMPLDMPLGERKIVGLAGRRIEPPDVPGLNLAVGPCARCEKVMSLKYTRPSGGDGDSFGQHCPSKSFSSFASGGTIGCSAAQRRGRETKDQDRRQPREGWPGRTEMIECNTAASRKIMDAFMAVGDGVMGDG